MFKIYSCYNLKLFNLDFDKFVGTSYTKSKQIKLQNTFHAEFVHFLMSYLHTHFRTHASSI